VTADRLDEAEQAQEDFLAATMPLPAIDIAGYEARPTPRFVPHAPATTPGAAPATAPATAPGAAAGADDVAKRAGLRTVARGGVLNLAGAVISALASVGLAVVVTRSVSKPAAGTFFVAMSLFLIVEAITNLGAYNGTIYFIARLRALRAERRIPAIIRATIVPVVISSVLGAAAMFAFGHPLARLVLDNQASGGVSAAALARSIRVLAVALPFAALADTMLGASRGYHEMRPTVVVDRIGRSTLQLAGVAAATLLSGSALLAPLWALPYVPAAVGAAIWLRRIMRRSTLPLAEVPTGVPTRSVPSSAADVRRRFAEMGEVDRAAIGNRHGKPNAKGFWRFTAPRSLASVAQIVIQRLDIVLVGIIQGPAQAAIYTAATRFLVAGQLGNAAISMAAQPQLTRLFAMKDRAGANTVYQVTTAWLILLTWPLYLLAVVFGPSVLAVFGRTYHAGSTVMVILALAMLVASACGQVDVVLITSGRSSWSLYNGLLAMSVNVGVDLALIPRMGITGAAIGWAAAIGLSNLVPLIQVAVVAKVHPFGRGTGAACALSVLCFAAIPLAVRSAAGTAPFISVAAIAMGCVVMALGLWLLHSWLHLSAIPGLGRRTETAGG
jgi:O-antigen/teichoic acid export membrane protein